MVPRGELPLAVLAGPLALATVKRSLTARPPTGLFSVNGAGRMLWLQEAKADRKVRHPREEMTS
jgi:hypothetical protein